MKDTFRKIVQSRGGGKVERCHGIPHQGSYNNAAHSWGAAMLLWYLFPERFKDLVLYLLSHDVPEFWVGDIPAPTLRCVPGVREGLTEIEARINRELSLPAESDLSPEDHKILKSCDRLDLWFWCREELLLGNQWVGECLTELEHYLEADGLFGNARRLWEECRKESVLPTQAGVMRKLTLKEYTKDAQ